MRTLGSLASLLVFVLFVLLPMPPALGDDPCDGQGEAALAIVPETLPAAGAYFTMAVTARPFAPVTVLVDVGPGPINVPRVGTFCLDLGPHRRTIFDGIRYGVPLLPASGVFEFSLVIPAREALVGRTFYMQAAVADPPAPNGIAITNMVPITIRPSLIENFTTTERKDAEATTAIWIGDGRAVGVVSPPRISEFVPLPQSPFLLAHPLIEVDNPYTPFGCRFQMRFESAAVGAVRGESIVGMNWAPRSNYLFPSSYPDMEVRLGYFAGTDAQGLDPFFDLNFDPDHPEQPLLVFQGNYEVPSSLDAPWHPWPEFSIFFPCDDDPRPIVFDVQIPEGGDTYQLLRNKSTASFPRNRLLANYGEDHAINWSENTQYNTQFVLQAVRSFAQSRFVDFGSEAIDYFTPRVESGPLPAGTSVKIELEGARDLDQDGLPDPETATGWRENADEVDGYRYVRFRVTLQGNPVSGGVPEVRLVVLPFWGQ